MSAALLVLYNIRRGILARWIHYLSAVVIFALLWVSTHSGMEMLDTPGSLGDYLLVAFSGRQAPRGMESVRIPAAWMCIFIGFLHSSLGFLEDSMNEYSIQICVRSHSRSCWWRTMYLWSVLSTLAYFLLALVTISLLTLFSGGKLSLVNSPDYALLQLYCDGFKAYEPLSDGQVLLMALVLPLAFAVVLELLQLCLSLFISPVQSFMVCIAMLIVSCYYSSPLSLGSYAMTMRSEYLVQEGLCPWLGLGLFSLLSAGLYLTGHLKAQRLDFMPRTKERV